LASYFSEGCSGVFCQAAAGLPAVQLFYCKESEIPGDMLLFQLLGCENILVFVVEQMKTDNFMRAFGGVAILGYEFLRSACNDAMVRYQTLFFYIRVC
jgi:hypothetical protein